MSVIPLDQRPPASPHDQARRRGGAPDRSEVAARLVAEPWRWWPAVRYDAERRYYRRLLQTEAYEAWLLTWLPGQGTGLHDHGGARGAFAVAVGELRETVVVAGGRHRRQATRKIIPGDVRGLRPEDVHEVSNRAG